MSNNIPTKEEARIAKDRELVAKMVGAKGAMEASIRRINDLENALRRVIALNADITSAISGVSIFTHYNAPRVTYNQDRKMVAVSELTQAVKDLKAQVLE